MRVIPATPHKATNRRRDARRPTPTATLAAVGLRVVVGEDALLVREGVVSLLETSAAIESVAAVGDHDALIALVAETRPDVVVTDVRMPPTNTDEGIRAAAAWRASVPDLGVVVLSQFVEPAYALRLFEQGSDGRAYLLKERLSDPSPLLHAVDEVARGGSVVDPLVIDSLVAHRSRGRESSLRRLTAREMEVLGEIAQGKNNAGVAQALGLTERAVEKHINSVFSKLDLRSSPDTHRRVKAVLLYLAARAQEGANQPTTSPMTSTEPSWL